MIGPAPSPQENALRLPLEFRPLLELERLEVDRLDWRFSVRVGIDFLLG
jgi:hypothetical protein